MALQQLDKCVVSTGDHSIEFSIILIEFANVAFDGEAINAVVRRYVTSAEERQGHYLITVRSPSHSVRVTAPKVCRQKNCFLFSDHVLLVVRTAPFTEWRQVRLLKIQAADRHFGAMDCYRIRRHCRRIVKVGLTTMLQTVIRLCKPQVFPGRMIPQFQMLPIREIRLRFLV